MVITTVSTVDALWTALKAAHGGDTIKLAPGNYGQVSLGLLNPNGMVTITSADPGHPAVITGLTVQDSSNMTFSHLELTPSPRNGFAVMVAGDTNVHLDSLNVHASTTPGGDAVMFRNSTNVSLTNSQLHDLGRGIVPLNSSGVTLTGNTIQHMSGDAIYTDSTSTVTSTGNTIVTGAASSLSGGVVAPITTGPVVVPPATPPAAGAGHIVVVSTADALWTALKSAHAGDTIELTAGHYGAVNLGGLNPGGMVTITSADASHPAVIAGLTVQDSSNMTFSHLELTPDARSGWGVTLMNDANVHLDSMNIHGPSTTSPSGSGVMLRNSTNVSISNSDVHDLGLGISHLNSDGVTISGNTIHDIQVDGIDGGGSSDITITKNTLSDFHPQAGDHPDAIQFWTSNTTASVHDIVVTDNVIARGSGAVVQGIFMNNENSLQYHTVTITGNALVGTMFNGILVYDASNVTVEHNLVEGYSDMTSKIWIDQVTGGVVDKNTTTELDVMTHNTGLSVHDNTIIAQGPIGDLSLLSQWSAVPPTVAAAEITFAPPPVVIMPISMWDMAGLNGYF